VPDRAGVRPVKRLFHFRAANLPARPFCGIGSIHKLRLSLKPDPSDFSGFLKPPAGTLPQVVEGLYLHVPFCHSICPFCAFAVHGDRPGLHGPYLTALEVEARRRAGDTTAPPGGVSSVYVGGGTPSSLSLAEIRRLLRGVRSCFPFAPDAEVALELNPEDAVPETLQGLAELGINRVSVGVQSLDGGALAALGRRHRPRHGMSALEALAGLSGKGGRPDNFNVDLMFGAPFTAPGVFFSDVETVLTFRPSHISLYGLDLEPGTLLARNPGVRDWAAAHQGMMADQYLWAAERLTAQGYLHYEVSNFCLPGREGRQNLLVWGGGTYLGLGPGSHSFGGKARWHNPRHLKSWLKGVHGGGDPADFWEAPTPAQRANEALMLALRQKAGLNIPVWEADHGFAWGEERDLLAHALADRGQAGYSGGRLALTPQGFLLADEITVRLAVPV